MSRATAFRAAALLLLAVAALAQPMVNAPLLNRVGYIEDGSSSATLPTTAAGGFAFTTIYNSTTGAAHVVALNLTADSPTGAPAFSMVLPWQPTSIFAATRERVGVICNDSVIFFGANWTDVWWVGTVSNPNLKFDLYPISTSSTQYDLPAVGWWGSVFVGTQNRTTSDWSAIYHINATTAMTVGMVSVPYYWTNYRLQFDMMTPDVVYALGRKYSGSGYNYILPIWISNMSMGTPIDTTSSYSSMRFNVNGGVAAAIDYYGYWYFLSLTNGSVLKNGELSCSSGSVNFEPGMIGGRWLIACGGYIGVFDNITLNMLATLTSPSGSGGFTAAIAENWSPMGSVVVASGQYVYVINGTVPTLVQVASITVTSGSGSLTPMAAMFVFNTSIVQVSYQSTWNGGGVIGIDTVSGKAVGQVTNVNPVGWGLWLPEIGLDIVASTSGPLLAAYNNWFNESLPAYITQLSTSSYTYRAFVANGTLGIYFNYNYVIKVNLTTGMTIGTPIVTSAGYTTTFGPIIVGEYACINTYYTTYCINTMTDAVVQQSTCYPDSRTPFSIVAGALIIRCYTGDVYSWAVPATSAYSISGYSYTPPVAGTTVMIYTSGSGLKGYTVPLASSSPTAKFTIPYTSMVISGQPAGAGENFVFMGYAPLAATHELTAVTTAYQFYVYSQTGSKVGSVLIPGMSSATAIATKVGGQYGSKGWAWVFNSSAMAGINLNTMTLAFQVLVDFQTGVQGSPFLTSQGGICFYGSSSKFYMHSAFNGVLAWWAPAQTGYGAQTPVEAGGAVYYSSGYNIIGADIFTGAQRTSVGYGNTYINGFAVMNNSATNQSSIFVTTQDNVIIATSAYIMPSAGYFAGGGGSGSGGSGSEKSKAWIAGVIIGVLVAVILVVVILKKKGSASTGDTDYVPMNPATQV